MPGTAQRSRQGHARHGVRPLSVCRDVLAMAIAGDPLTRSYPGSWSEWCTDPKRPVGNRSDEFGATARFDDPLCWLSAGVELPLFQGKLV
jgi:hypothetical protein